METPVPLGRTRRPGPPRRLRRLGRLAVRVLAGMLALLILGCAGLWSWWRSEPSASVVSVGPNAVWERHLWVGEEHSEAEYDALAAQLRALAMTDVFFHVGPLAADGTIDPARYPAAEALVAALEQRVPALRVQAWIGQIERRGGGPLDLGDPLVRGRVVATAEGFLNLGFDGIHYDIEPWFPSDQRFLALLRDTAAVTRPREAVLSASTVEIEPVPGGSAVLATVVKRNQLWTPAAYAEVGELVDQVAVMSYDTAMPTGWAYGSLLANQVRRIRAAVPEDVTVFVGVPSYDEPNLGHHPRAENVAIGVRGVRKGLEGLAPEQRERTGVAVYAGWTTDAGEWATYQHQWLGVDGPRLEWAPTLPT